MDEPGGGETLIAECRVFCRYLVGIGPPSDVVAAYQKAHALGVVNLGRPTPMDRALLRVAGMGPALARTADAYAAVFARSGLLRRKLVLLIAILESRASTATLLDTAVPGSLALWVVGVAIQSAAWTVRVALAAVCIIPLTIWYSFVGSR